MTKTKDDLRAVETFNTGLFEIRNALHRTVQKTMELLVGDDFDELEHPFFGMQEQLFDLLESRLTNPDTPASVQAFELRALRERTLGE